MECKADISPPNFMFGSRSVSICIRQCGSLKKGLLLYFNRLRRSEVPCGTVWICDLYLCCSYEPVFSLNETNRPVEHSRNFVNMFYKIQTENIIKQVFIYLHKLLHEHLTVDKFAIAYCTAIFDGLQAFSDRCRIKVLLRQPIT